MQMLLCPVRHRGNIVHLSPSALEPGRAEQTLAQLDRLQATLGRSRAPPPAQRLRISKFKDVTQAAGGLLDDLNEGPEPGQQQTQQAGPPPAGTQPTLPQPEFKISQLPADQLGPARVELEIQLPLLMSPGDAEVDCAPHLVQLDAAGLYHLKVRPYMWGIGIKQIQYGSARC